jgi:hypothetical protein
MTVKVKLPEECILLQSIFSALHIPYLPVNSKELDSAIEPFLYYLYNIAIKEPEVLVQSFSVLSQHIYKDKILKVIGERNDYTYEYAILYIQECLNVELNLFQEINNITGLYLKPIKIDGQNIDYWLKKENLQLTPHDKQVLPKYNKELGDVLINLINKNEMLIYENNIEKGLSKYKQISLDKFKEYINTCVHIKLHKDTLIDFHFLNSKVQTFVTRHRRYKVKEGKFIFEKSVVSQHRILYALNNIKRQEQDLKKTYSLFVKKQLINEVCKNPNDITDDVKIQIQKINLELLFLGITDNNLKEASDKLNRKLLKLKTYLDKIKKIQIKYKISGLQKVNVILEGKNIDLYDVYPYLNLTVKDKSILAKQKEVLIKYWYYNLQNKKVFYKVSDLTDVSVEINDAELLSLFVNSSWVLPYSTENTSGLYLVDEHNFTSKKNGIVFAYD